MIHALVVLVKNTNNATVKSKMISYNVKKWGEYILIALKNGEMKVVLSDLGAMIQSLYFNNIDVALGFDSPEEYLSDKNPFMGSIPARFAGRIKGANFSLDGVEYKLPKRFDGNSLHTGELHRLQWRFHIIEKQNAITVEFSVFSPDGYGGFAGNVNIKVAYTLDDKNNLRFDYHASSDKKTYLNITNHNYFNLDGCGDVLDHSLQVDADAVLEIYADAIPTGKLYTVANTPFDFRVAKKIGKDIDLDDKILKYGGGYDHSFVLNNKLSSQVVLSSSKTYIKMNVTTTLPIAQIYTANGLDMLGKNSTNYHKHAGIAIETQYAPDSPNNNFKIPVISQDKPFEAATIFKFENFKSK